MHNFRFTKSDLGFISDLGLSQPADKPVKSDEVYGVLPYIVPEVLRGEPYTKAADIYSFGIIMWEMNSGIPAFNNVPHDLNLALNICQGLRPRTVKSPEIYYDAEVQKQYEDLEVEYVKLMKRCGGPDPSKRPTAEELYENFDGWHDQLLIFTNNVNIISIDERIPSTIGKYRKIDYSAKLNEILSQRELSSKTTINDIENNEEIIISSESLENCKISSSEIGPIQNLDNKEKESNE
ncbi:kinase-like domain-containing protein [Rhizophagus irregularis DAOM 181602=DAOM 197198]|uniref:Kinase-like domain-containing protein n=1 Tax=Rhizophagus irregularis (strain DAOM 181602 / DAOM 197198 / MUCL 43194) TaxID=747089 RepID=A0A2P4PUN3_RHIID|nr:kinase-like domain-containing protein [Rhizophagus irregularis DAOM 181602=DAOM 197198]POG69091.1 kinase-like domain-containing protein [Rhizophagus irregularis DAOM 181602=DAOM 197198]|eukprot:XP_025175957.1 kinase-like domain-containing protein [Rhizophagus irregularis DAOM 181602=DAOM 197198]